MSQFPSDFADSTQRLIADDFASQADKDFLTAVEEKGFELHYGLTAEMAEAIVEMALEPAIKEYCPNDHGSRFSSLEATRAWLQKGRAVFLLVKGNQLAGYGWTGDSESRHVPGGQTTFAIRIGEAGQGQGMATPFARLIVAASAALNEAQDFWLETWQSNAAAVHIYHKIGFEDVAEESGERPTNEGGNVADTRIFMRLSNEKL